MTARVLSGDFKHWSRADLDRESERYREYLARGLKENEARGYYLVPVESYARRLDAIETARHFLRTT